MNIHETNGRSVTEGLPVLATFGKWLDKNQHSIPAPAKPFAYGMIEMIANKLSGRFNPAANFPKLFGAQLARFAASRQGE